MRIEPIVRDRTLIQPIVARLALERVPVCLIDPTPGLQAYRGAGPGAADVIIDRGPENGPFREVRLHHWYAAGSYPGTVIEISSPLLGR